MNTKHTPGEWFGGSTIFDGTYCIVGDGDSVVCEFRNRSGATLEADARLIAAAPELLEALVAAVDCRMVPVSSAKDGACRHSMQVEVADMIRAAIAKATGEQA